MHNHNSLVESVPRLIDMVNKIGIKIKMISLDREFYTAQVFRDLNKKYLVILCRNVSYVKQAIKEFDHNKRKDVSLHTIEYND